jgi:hypothetical protein
MDWLQRSHIFIEMITSEKGLRRSPTSAFRLIKKSGLSLKIKTNLNF